MSGSSANSPRVGPAGAQRRSPAATIAASPTMVGAVTTLIVILTVFLAYNANQGLPFVPTYRVSVDVPNAARMAQNNEVRIGGARVGVVDALEPVIEEDEAAGAAAQGGGTDAGDGFVSDAVGEPAARLSLKLDQHVEPLPQDSIFRVRYRSSFGLKYLEIIRGEGPPAPEGFVFDGTDGDGTCRLPTGDDEDFTESLPESARDGCFQDQTEFDAIQNTFDEETRENSRRNLFGYGSAFAGRGASLNEAIHNLEPLLRLLRPVAQTLTDPETRLRNFFPALARSARIVAPVAARQAEFFSFAATTFAAISSDPDALREAITEGTDTLETGLDVLPQQRVFLGNLETFSRELRPGARDLRTALPALNEMVEVGTPVLEDAPATNRRLRAALLELERLLEQPETRITLMRLGDTFDSASSLATYVVPAQTVCNYWNYWFTFLPAGLTDQHQVGYAFRQILTQFPLAPVLAETGLGGYSGRGANARAGLVGGGEFRPYELPLSNANVFAPTGQENADCQAGQRGYALGDLTIPGQAADDPGNKRSNLPGSRGPTTLFYDADGERDLADTRVPSRQPETWGGRGR